MIFFSRNHRPMTLVPPIGDGTAPIYEEIIENGVTVLKKTGVDNLFEYVQSSKEESLVYNIISRYQRGDITALSQRVGQYMDVVGMPTNLAEAYSTMLDVRAKFDALPVDIRKQFNNDINVFIDVVSHATPEQLQGIFGVTQAQVNEVKDGDTDVA